MKTTLIRRAATVAAASLLLVACGDDDTTTAASDATETSMDGSGDIADMDGMDHGDDQSHDHAGIEVGDLDAVPTLSATATPDAKAGVNLQVETTNFAFAPEHASTDHVAGEGHAHVYVDGEKVARLYTEWMHLSLAAGAYEIRVELNANDHSPLVVDDAPIEQVIEVTVPESDDGHMHGDAATFAAGEPVPTVAIEAVADAKSGYNVHVTTTDFTFTPELASTMETTSGEGHAHLYLDGTKVSRLYGDWYHLDADLTPGEHELRVELNANDHAVYTDGGEPIEATTTIIVVGDAASEEASSPDGATVLEVMVMGDRVEGGGRQAVQLGSTVVLRVTSDAADHVHVHGYDLFADVAAGETAELTFVADIPGVFEVELEDSRLPLLDLEVS